MIPSTGFKDKRVDKMVEKLGISLSECTIFYSPISVYFLFVFLLFAAAFPISLFLLKAAYDFPIYVACYFGISYLLAAYLNNSFVTTDKELIAINPNFPFKRIEVYEYAMIEKIHINQSDARYLTGWFLVISMNYARIDTKNTSKRFYCSGLEIDAYDENWTERTLDDFHEALKNKGLTVEFELD